MGSGLVNADFVEKTYVYKRVSRMSAMMVKWPHEGPKMAQVGPKMAQVSPKTAQDGARMAPRRPKMAPRRPKGATWDAFHCHFNLKVIFNRF